MSSGLLAAKRRHSEGFQTQIFDVLLSNIGLPDGNGWDLIREVGKSRPAYAIAMSGFGTKADCERSAEAGFGHHLVKPVSVAELAALLDQVVAELRGQ